MESSAEPMRYTTIYLFFDDTVTTRKYEEVLFVFVVREDKQHHLSQAHAQLAQRGLRLRIAG